MKPYYRFIVALVIVSVVAAGAELLVRRGPAHDNTIVSDLSSIQSMVDSYYLSENKLPSSLSTLSLDADIKSRLTQYDYNVLARDRYQLCATFLTTSSTPGDTRYSAPVAPSPGGVTPPNPAMHGKGRQCFTYTTIAIQPYPVPAKD